MQCMMITAVMHMQVMLCTCHAMQMSCYADAVQVMLCWPCCAGHAMLIMLCRSCYADHAVQVMLC
jgi:hypothetical protein